MGYKDPFSKSSFPYQRIFEKVHDLELLRCWKYGDMEFKVKWLENDVGKSAANKLFLYAEQLIEATGDYLKWRPSRMGIPGGEKQYSCKKFSQAGRNVAKAFELARRVTPPTFDVDEDLPTTPPHPSFATSVSTFSRRKFSFTTRGPTSATPVPTSPRAPKQPDRHNMRCWYAGWCKD